MNLYVVTYAVFEPQEDGTPAWVDCGAFGIYSDRDKAVAALDADAQKERGMIDGEVEYFTNRSLKGEAELCTQGGNITRWAINKVSAHNISITIGGAE